MVNDESMGLFVSAKQQWGYIIAKHNNILQKFSTCIKCKKIILKKVIHICDHYNLKLTQITQIDETLHKTVYLYGFQHIQKIGLAMIM